MAEVAGATSPVGQAIFRPSSVALVGASGDPTKASSRPLQFLQSGRYEGRVYAVNRRGGRIGDVELFTSLAALPEVPDHAFIMTPTAGVLDAVEQCGRLGVSVATILAGGFGEVGAAGLALQDRLRDVAQGHGVRLLGPNSLGVVNTSTGLRLTANAAFVEEDITPGGLCVASQSGSMIGALLSRGTDRGIGFSRLASVGAEMDISIGELCASTLDDADVTGYLLFLETIRHGTALRQFAHEAARRGKPVVAYKLGRSEMAAQLAASHTGALAGEDDVASAFLADCGIARVHTLDALLEAPALLASTPALPGARRRTVGVVTTTGGGAAMVVDQLGVRGTAVVPATDLTLARLAEVGVHVEPGLIVDLTLTGTRPEIMRAALTVLSTAPEFDMILAVAGSSARHSPELAVEPVIEVAGQSGSLPIAAFLVPHAPRALSLLTDAGIACFRTPEACADAISAAMNRRPPRPDADNVITVEGPSHLIDEAASYAVLSSIGIPSAQFSVVDVSSSPTELPSGLSYPVVVKVLSARLPHKSDLGGVRVGVTDDEQLAEAAADVRRAVESATDVAVDRILIQEMVDCVGEYLLGFRVDPQMGPLVMLGAGGTRAELYSDRSIRMAPVDRDTAEGMLDEVAAVQLLRGFRGAPLVDLQPLVEAVVGISGLAHNPSVVEAEINPLMVSQNAVTAVDAVLRITDESRARSTDSPTPSQTPEVHPNV